MRRTSALIFGSVILAATAPLSAPASELVLFYDEPAKEWTEALPIGNGRVGAMIFGGVGSERLQLNEDTLWAGGPYDPVNPDARAALPKVRRLINESKFREASDLIAEKVIAKPSCQMPYATVGSLHLSFPDADTFTDYRRDLDLETATASVSYASGGVRFTREMFASAPDGVIVVHLSSDKPCGIAFTASMDTPMDAVVTSEGGNTLVMRGRGGDMAGIKGALDFQARVRVLAEDGRISAEQGRISVSGSSEVTILIAAATSFVNFHDVGADPGKITDALVKSASAKSFDELRRAHVADYQRLFQRVRIDLGTSESAHLPTDERIRRFADGNDPQLAALYYQFGRYLLISSSRPGGQPANLQGLWNDSVNPPWQSKYTININTEMNYWPAESGNLAECVEPLVSMVEDLRVTGRRTAEEMYGAAGWVAHHNTDLWRATAPIDGPIWGMWPTGGAWLCLHLWDRYEYSGDLSVLRRIYPVMKGASEFFLDTLQDERSHGWLVTNPSISPENSHPFGTSVCAGPTMDMQILRDLFANTIRASTILGRDEAFRAELEAARARLAPNRIGSSGQLQEWLEDWDMSAPELDHRHVSHLYGLFPGRDFSLRGNPDLAAAAKKSLEIRGDESTGWATAWRICLWAHLGDGEHAYAIIRMLLSPGLTYPDLFDAHPPFQIDGNFGGAAGIAEMLMQSTGSTIDLLPALPRAWPEGSISGLRARGGFEIDIAWKDGKLTKALLRSEHGGTTLLRSGASTREVTLPEGGSFEWDGK